MLIAISVISGLAALLIAGLILLYFLNYKDIKKKHDEMFNHRFSVDPRIKSYTNEDFNLDTKQVKIPCGNETLTGYLYSYKEPKEDVIVVFFHGMYSSKESYLQEIGYIANKGFLVLGFDYLGTNESDGVLTGFGSSLKCADAAIKYIKSNPDLANKKIYTVGHSWGGYAAGCIVGLHPDIAGTVLLAPFNSTIDLFMALVPNAKHKSMFINYDNKLTNGYSKYTIINSLKNYQNKVLVIQSKSDPVVPFQIGLGKIQEKLHDNANIKYLMPENRLHNPDYTVEASNYFIEFQKALKNVKKKDEDKLFSSYDFKKMGELDPEIMDKIIEFFE